MLQYIFPYFFEFLVSLLLVPSQAEQDPILNPPFQTEPASAWADSVYNNMSNDERIGQLFMVAAWSNKGEAHVKEIENQIKKNHIGGLIFFQGGPGRQVHLTNRYQSISKIPLLIGIDGEWGLNMRLDSTIRFPRQMTIGAANSPKDVYSMGKEIANHCKALGIHINFAPVVDVNNNPLNPVINSRSFGENREDVTELSKQYMLGMQDNGVLACAKHFPGHGNADTDSHYDLPVINQPLEVLDSIELYPY
ncbi:MAG: glycosyl hydrolase, partial [Bacteroidia bacterium]|nr:glycosyl hydrolase [Bacteroidia bacterium]NNM15792.1 glycosyl hydrolase [Bacteroidia bacterium]